MVDASFKVSDDPETREKQKATLEHDLPDIVRIFNDMGRKGK